MTPPKVGVPSTVARKQSKRPTVTPEVEEIPEASTFASQANFHKDYVPLRKYNVSQFKVPVDEKYPLETSLVPPSVIIEGDMLGKVSSLNFVYHNMKNEHKFPKMSKEKYLCSKSVSGTRDILLET